MKKFFNKVWHNIKLFFSWLISGENSFIIFLLQAIVIVWLIILGYFLAGGDIKKQDFNYPIVDTLNAPVGNNYVDNKNLASPYLTGKEYLGNGVYRLYDDNGVTIDYNVYNGIYTLNGTSTLSGSIGITNYIFGENTYTMKMIIINKSHTDGYSVSLYSYDGIPLFAIDLYYQIGNMSTEIQTTSTYTKWGSDRRVNLYVNKNTVFDNHQFKLQLEKGTTATDYEIPYAGEYLKNTSHDNPDVAVVAPYPYYGRVELIIDDRIWSDTYTNEDGISSGIYYIPVSKLPISINNVKILGNIPPVGFIPSVGLDIGEHFYTFSVNGGPVPKTRFVKYNVTDINFIDVFSYVGWGKDNSGFTNNVFYFLGEGLDNFVLTPELLSFTDYENNNFSFNYENMGRYLERDTWSQSTMKLYFNSKPYFNVDNLYNTYEDGYNKGKEDGYKLGYDVGYPDGQASDFGFTTLLSSVFVGLGSFLSINLLPGISIGAIIAVPIVFGIIYFIIGKRKGD